MRLAVVSVLQGDKKGFIMSPDLVLNHVTVPMTASTLATDIEPDQVNLVLVWSLFRGELVIDPVPLVEFSVIIEFMSVIGIEVINLLQNCLFDEISSFDFWELVPVKGLLPCEKLHGRHLINESDGIKVYHYVDFFDH